MFHRSFFFGSMRINCFRLIIVLSIFLSAIDLAAQRKATKLQNEMFREVVFQQKKYFICSFSPHKYKVEIYNRRDTGSGVYDFASLARADKKLLYAVNGGMYDERRHAIGLLVSAGKTQHKVNQVQKGSGNFNLMPNGIFYVDRKDNAYVVSTPDYVARSPKPRCATQSGPMLVIDGAFNTHFTKNSSNLNIRNGVGVDSSGNVLLVISLEGVNFYEFAELFRDRLGCPNALYLDGFVSQYFLPRSEAAPKPGVMLGPIICVSESENK